MLYNNFSSYLKEKYGGKVKKICIDGGFGCPNRDGTCGRGGCIYCGERGAGEHIDNLMCINEQVARAIEKAEKAVTAKLERKFMKKRGVPEKREKLDTGATCSRKSDAEIGDFTLSEDEIQQMEKAKENLRFIAYFQNFTNTYADTETLKERYDASLIDERIVALSIGTRPDCITEQIAELVASYKDRVDVWVELGLQTASDRVAEVMNRGYPLPVYQNAVKILKKFDIPVVTHMIIGLPEDNPENIDKTVDCINETDTWGIKIHSIYVMTGTQLAKLYRQGKYNPPTRVEFVTLCARCIARLRPQMTIHRITGDCPDGMLVAPDWNKDKNGVIEDVRKLLESQGLKQGSLYKKE